MRNPVNDARAVGERLQRLGFVVIRRENLRTREIGPALREFRSRLSAGAVALFFYAGHGLQVKGVNYLPAVDADIEAEEDVPNQSLNVVQVLELMEDAKTRVNLVFLDACRDNPFARRFRSASRGLAKVDAASGTLISFATRPGSVASDGEGKNGLYTEYLIKHMDDAGLPIEQMLKRVGAGVKLASRGRQEPWSEGLIEGDFFFHLGQTALTVSSPTVDPAAVEFSIWDSIKASSNAEDFRAYLQQYPNGRFAVFARNRLNAVGTPQRPSPPQAHSDASPAVAQQPREPAQVASIAPTVNASRPNVNSIGTPFVSQGKRYDPGASDVEIRIGNTNPYSGPASAYGAIGKTIGAYFRMVNDQGGINGRRITFITYDDGYSPPKTVEMVRRLVEVDNVLFLFQTLGTPSNTAIHRYMNARKVPQLHVATGATKWNDPKNFPWTMGWQPNYQTEGRVYATHILQTRPNAKIGILYQNDDYGKDYLKGIRDGLGDKARSMIVAEVAYDVTEPTVDSQIVQLQASGANVFVNITTPKFAAQAIRKAYDIGWKPVQYLNNVSSSVGSVLVPAGLEKSVGLITTAYLKDPTDERWAKDPAITKWQTFMKKYNPEVAITDNLGIYGYTVAETLALVLKQCGDNLTRENVMRQAASMNGTRIDTLLPGITIRNSADDYAPIGSVQLERFDGREWELFGQVIGGKE